MLVVHEIHQVVGSRAREFEATYRERWLPALQKGGDARLLWYANHAHLTCFAYHVLTLTAVPDGAAWLRLARRVHAGDLLEPTRALDPLRHDVEAKLLHPETGSPIPDPDATREPSASPDDGATLFIEDTFHTEPGAAPPPADAMAEEVATFRVAHPQHAGDERITWRRVRRPELLLASLTEGDDAAPERAGALHHESRLWRVAPFSPLA